ncbi:hypothetical protein ASPZODRAFT_142308 [Penicilliopsis zonata CBS 506.65]|uniref:Peptidase S7 domain-containing protein n=1 Tax=Penicilliopsis zonata CBS 506.65 TaxID=1073090 RepID=A0A1L9SHH8_9EURO|nr:hypothetical protein ASPZODRAFT_142308 [Penicilliopsis zonata CBS 506.65]OJJ46494.1 hypothetical protein ASPZODRAFT_142308 [Penicilliopsis zonata CBS 506.65]
MPFRYNRGSDAELVWASSAKEFKGGFQFLMNKQPGSDRRDRRTRGSSKDDEGETEEFINEELRVGGPLLCPLPATSQTILDPTSRYNEILNSDAMLAAIQEILIEHGITLKDASVGMQTPEWFPQDPPIVTLTILATKSTVHDEWLQACQRLHTMLVLHEFPDISVEIIDPRAMLPRFTTPLFRTDKLFLVWDRVLSIILDSIDLADIIVISCWRYGVSSTAEENPPTIIITVDRNSSRRWKPLREKVVSILDANHIDDVAVLVEKGRVFRSMDKAGVPSSLWQQRQTLPGVSLGNTVDLDTSATFGGYIELQNQKGEWYQFGLTCYHAVLAPETVNENKQGESTACTDSDLLLISSTVQLSWDGKGAEWNDPVAKEVLAVQQPSRQDLQEEKISIQQQINRIADQKFLANRAMMARGELSPLSSRIHVAQERNLHDLETIMSQINTFDEERMRLGHVVCASGFRLKTMRNSDHPIHLDWALIMLDKRRIGHNRVDSYGPPRFRLPCDIINQPIEPEHGMLLYKMGRSTEWTEGLYNSLQTAVIEKKTVATREAVVCGTKGRQFADTGDSGSFVFTKDLEFVGMIFATHARGDGYITLASSLFEDIKAKTGAMDIRLPGPDIRDMSQIMASLQGYSVSKSPFGATA